MRRAGINWVELKSDYSGWREELYGLTKELLTSSDRFELSKYNEEGYFHHVSSSEQFRQMRVYWDGEKRVPEEWIAKGSFPGIWTAMFDSHNTYSWAPTPICVLRFFFREGFLIYDVMNPKHRNILSSWKSNDRKNPWGDLKNDSGKSLEQRMRSNGLPSHKCFFEDNNFGAVIGYSDYVSPVIVLEESIENVRFLEID